MAVVTINERKQDNNFVVDVENGTSYYRVPKPQEAVEVAFTFITSADTNLIEPAKDHKTLVLIKSANTAGTAKEVTFKAGDTFAGYNDFVIEVDGGTEVVVALESAKFANKFTGNITVETNEATANKIGIAVLETR